MDKDLKKIIILHNFQGIFFAIFIFFFFKYLFDFVNVTLLFGVEEISNLGLYFALIINFLGYIGFYLIYKNVIFELLEHKLKDSAKLRAKLKESREV